MRIKIIKLTFAQNRNQISPLRHMYIVRRVVPARRLCREPALLRVLRLVSLHSTEGTQDFPPPPPSPSASSPGAVKGRAGWRN
jgi:hypothetical protein